MTPQPIVLEFGSTKVFESFQEKQNVFVYIFARGHESSKSTISDKKARAGNPHDWSEHFLKLLNVESTTLNKIKWPYWYFPVLQKESICFNK